MHRERVAAGLSVRRLEHLDQSPLERSVEGSHVAGRRRHQCGQVGRARPDSAGRQSPRDLESRHDRHVHAGLERPGEQGERDHASGDPGLGNRAQSLESTVDHPFEPLSLTRGGEVSDPVAEPASRSWDKSGPDEPSARLNRSQLTGPPSANARLPRRRSSPRQVKRTGNKLAFSFWDCVANRGRWPRQKTARDSPLRAVYRLYGRVGPLYAIGVPPGGYVEEMAASTYPSQPGAPELTVGSVTASGEEMRLR